MDVFGNRGGYTYANLGDARQERPITANDLVNANGACPGRRRRRPLQALRQPALRPHQIWLHCSAVASPSA